MVSNGKNVSKGPEHLAASELQPLNAAESDIEDFEKFFEGVLKVRLPMLNKEMQFVVPPHPKVVGPKHSWFVADSPEERVGCDCCEVPTAACLATTAGKFKVDTVLIGILMTVSVVLWKFASKDIFEYWTLFGGAGITIWLIVGSVNYIQDTYYKVMGDIESVIDKAVQTLCDEVDGLVEEGLQLLGSLGVKKPDPKDVLAVTAEKDMAHSVADIIRKGIQEAKKLMKVSDVVPAVVITRQRAFLLLAGPPILLVILKAIIRKLIGLTGLMADVVLLEILVVAGLAALIKGKCCVRLVSNTIFRAIQSNVDAYLKKSLKGGEHDVTHELQEVVQVVDDAGGGCKICEFCRTR